MQESLAVSSPAESPRELPALADAAEGDRPSITEVNGTVARFDMSYPAQDEGPVTFGPPLRQRLPSFVYMTLSIAGAIVVFTAPAMARGSLLFRWVVEGDSGRPVSAAFLALIVMASALGTVIRAHMRGVIVKKEGLEARYLLALGFPRIRRWTWAQVHRMVVDDGGVMLELWNSTYARLPEVADPKGLARLLEAVGSARAIQVTRLKAGIGSS